MVWGLYGIGVFLVLDGRDLVPVDSSGKHAGGKVRLQNTIRGADLSRL